jgi:phosphoglycolate phosphatase-like HAD superfamily hydrolase
MIDLGIHATIVFDCDGVVLNSNSIKTEAFRIAALPWGSDAADALVAHHVANGGISRHRKFAYFLESILPLHAPTAIPGVDGPGLDELLSSYAQAVRGGMMTCAVAEGLEDLRAQTPDATWCIVSGGDQAELREIFAARRLDHLFDGGIFGSPDSKDTILAREQTEGTIQSQSLFLGDSRYDYECASRAGLDFIFVAGWTDVANWEEFVGSHNIKHIHKISGLLG